MSTAPFGSDFRPVYPDRLPTLTEVLELGRGEVVDLGVTAPLPEVAPPEWVPAPSDFAPSDAELNLTPSVPRPLEAIDEQALVKRVLEELSPRVELMFEARMREAMAPALAGAADLMIRETRAELLATLTDLVAEAVARALDRHSTP
jgi:hypothetical protein